MAIIACSAVDSTAALHFWQLLTPKSIIENMDTSIVSTDRFSRILLADLLPQFIRIASFIVASVKLSQCDKIGMNI
jgi:hypothetical protein